MPTALSFRPNLFVVLLTTGLALGSTIASRGLSQRHRLHEVAAGSRRVDSGRRGRDRQPGGSDPSGEAGPGCRILRMANLSARRSSTHRIPALGASPGHATAVGQAFYGTVTSMAPAITTISAYLAENWQSSGFTASPIGSGGFQPKYSTSRIANHSWVAAPPAAISTSCAALDWLVETDEFIQVVGMNNGSGGSSHRALDGQCLQCHRCRPQQWSARCRARWRWTPTYTAGRTRPDIVAPASGTSTATPYVASAAAMLVELGHGNPGLSRTRCRSA